MWSGRADLRPERAYFRPEKADLRSGRADLKPEGADFRPEKADLRSGIADLRPERDDFRPEKTDLRSGGANLRADLSPGMARGGGDGIKRRNEIALCGIIAGVQIFFKF